MLLRKRSLAQKAKIIAWSHFFCELSSTGRYKEARGSLAVVRGYGKDDCYCKRFPGPSTAAAMLEAPS